MIHMLKINQLDLQDCKQNNMSARAIVLLTFFCFLNFPVDRSSKEGACP